MKDVIVKKLKIDKQGVFANRDFQKGEVVLKWSPKELTNDEFEKLSEKENKYIVMVNDKILLMQSPERYVNHSCEPNTVAKDNCDVAFRDIKKGEEITSEYAKLQCGCGSKDCKEIIN